MKMIKHKNVPKWKPIPLDGSIFNDGSEFDGLVGIEECSDYQLDCDQRKKRKTESLEVEQKCVLSNKKKHKHSKDISSSRNLLPSKNGSTANCLESHESIENESEVLMDGWVEYDLPEVILKGIKEQGFTHPTRIQYLTLPPAIFGRQDILGAAETGSGKTLAFGLPILSAIVKMKNEKKSTVDEHPLYALILTPTRELAIQVKNCLQAVAKYSDIKIAVVVGGLAAVKQERILNKFPEIVVATPGRLWELIQLGYNHLSKINEIRYLVIDETDRMLEKGHFQELHNLLEKINADDSAKKHRQNFVFSATLTLVHDLPKYRSSKMKPSKRNLEMTPQQKLKKIIGSLGITNPKVVDITEGKGLSQTLTECRVNCAIQDKDYYVYYFLKKHPGRTIIFCNSIGCVKRLATLLNLLQCKSYPLHASMQQRQRLKNLEQFRDTNDSILIATDVAARGLDIPCVDHVLHYQIPRTSESYVHRSGRTARANNEGLTLLLMESSEVHNYIKICRTLEKNEDIPVFPVEENSLNSVKKIVNLARELDKLQLQNRKRNSEIGWFEKTAKETDMILDHMSLNHDSEERSNSMKWAALKRKQLTDMLGKPVFPVKISGKYFSPLDLPLHVEESAIEVMKNFPKRKKSVSIYKPNRRMSRSN